VHLFLGVEKLPLEAHKTVQYDSGLRSGEKFRPINGLGR